MTGCLRIWRLLYEALLPLFIMGLLPMRILATTVHDPQVYAQVLRQLEQTAAQYAKQITHWQEQINHFKEQGNLLKEQLAGLTGLREIGDLEGELSSLILDLKGINKHREVLNSMLRSSDEGGSPYIEGF